MQQKLTGDDSATDVQFGAGKVVFKPDTKLTATANLTDPVTGENTGLAQVATAIAALLVKGGYPSVTPDLDPSGLYAP